MKRLLGLFLPLLPGLVVAQVPTYQQDVAPILERHCTSCHSGWFPSAGLRLNSLESIREGSRSGPLIVPGKADKGWLVYVLTQTEGRYRMPPEGPQVSERELQLIRDWIAAGAR